MTQNIPADAVYFVLNGLVNGEEHNYAIMCGPVDAPRMFDGWYFLVDDEDYSPDGVGPWDSREEAQREYLKFAAEAQVDSVVNNWLRLVA